MNFEHDDSGVEIKWKWRSMYMLTELTNRVLVLLAPFKIALDSPTKSFSIAQNVLIFRLSTHYQSKLWNYVIYYRNIKTKAI